MRHTRLVISNAHTFNTGGSPRNLGDLALLEVAYERFKERNSYVRVICGNPGHCGDDGITANAYPLEIGAIIQAIRWCDGLILTGGTLIQDDQPGTFRGLPRYIFTLALIATLLGKKTIAIGVGAEEIRNWVKRALVKWAISRFELIATRDEYSLKVVQALAPSTRVEIGGDLYLARPQIPHASKSASMVFALRKPELIDAIDADVIPANSIAVGMDPADIDLDVERMTKLKSRCRVVSPASWQEAAELLASARVVLASRMHALYFASNGNAKCAAVVVNSKLESYCKDFRVSGFPTVVEAFSYLSTDSGEASPESHVSFTEGRERAQESIDEALSLVRAG